jgi:hypothetical protein
MKIIAIFFHNLYIFTYLFLRLIGKTKNESYSERKIQNNRSEWFKSNKNVSMRRFKRKENVIIYK